MSMSQSQRHAPRAVLVRLGSTYWFLPSIVTGLAVALATGLVALDRMYPDAITWLGWAYGGGADGARALLSAVAASTMTVVSVTFSVMVVALTVSSQHFGPRLLNSFMRDHTAQLMLGTFTGTFAYCLVVLRTVQGDGGDRYEFFVPHLAVSGAVVLTLFSIAMLIYYVHHVARKMQVSEITAGVARDLEDAVERLYPERFGEGAEPPVQEPPPVPAGAMTVTSTGSGYIQEVDGDRVLALASAHDATIWLEARPGDFVVEGTPLAAVHPPPADAGRVGSELTRAVVIGVDRTPFQDVGFAVQQLVEVALRALSPGMNEPFTALTCIDRLGQGLCRLASRRLPSALRTDEDGRLRVVGEPKTFEALVCEAFEPIALFADRNPAVGERLLANLARLARVARQRADREAIRAVASRVDALAGRELVEEAHLARLSRLRAEVHRLLDARAHDEVEAGALPAR